MVCSLVVVIGTAGYTWIEGWTAWQSLFFTLVTLTTVGYGDYGLSEQGERFTAILMIGGIASVSYAASQFIQYATTCVMQPEHRMIQKAKRLSGHYIVCGLGRTGQRVMTLLREEGISFVAIDPDEGLVEQARNEGVIAICGDATTDRVLLDAGVERAGAIAAVTSQDSVNAMICLGTRALCPKIKISARAEGDDSVQKLKRAGANTVINPARYGGDGIAQSLIHPETVGLLFDCGDGATRALQFSEIVVDQESHLINQRIIDFGVSNPNVVIVGILETNGEFSMRPDTKRRLADGDILFIAGSVVNEKALSNSNKAA
ncbi:MAG: potassium channel protein [Phycisphaerales bacterium]|nr:potassium channel protein [Phycisphaerales bacterium]